MRHVALPFEELAEPGETLLELDVLLCAFLVAPMGGDAVLGEAVHLMGADLDLERARFDAHDCRVERLVDTLARTGDVVVELARDRAPEAMNGAEHGVTISHAVHEDTEGEEVVDFVERLALCGIRLHLLVDAVDVLGATLDGGLDVLRDELFLDDLFNLRDVTLARCTSRRDELGYLVVLIRVKVLER